MAGTAAPDRAPTTVAGLVGFTHVLRQVGVACDAQRVDAYLQAVECLDISNPAALYWAGRVTLCGQPDDLPRYDDAFAAWFSTRPVPHQRVVAHVRPRPMTIAALREAQATGESGAQRREVPALRVAASDVEVLRRRDISALSAAEREHLRELLALLRVQPPRRRALRHRPARGGRVDSRRTLRAMLASGGEPARLYYRDRRDRPRKVVLLVDVSGSMKPYADALLRFAHTVTRRAPASTEVFTLGTRLTRVSRQLRQRDPDQALRAAGNAVPDFAGGTRLGEGVRAFLDRWGQRGAARQAVVVMFSDGWERGDPSLLGEQMARMRRLAHTVLWVNPHAGRASYRPVQSGIAVALPHLDRLLAGHSLETLEALLREMRDA